jgi:hypothetical protein
MNLTAKKYYRVCAAQKDVNARGRVREWWYRMLFDPTTNTWRYLAPRRLASGNFLARDRQDAVYAHVAVGDIVAEHDRGGPIKAVYLVQDDAADPLLRLSFKRYLGRLLVTTSDGSVLDLPDPRS